MRPFAKSLPPKARGYLLPVVLLFHAFVLVLAVACFALSAVGLTSWLALPVVAYASGVLFALAALLRGAVRVFRQSLNG
ncbi:MAG TPA: hypothetical protein VEH27_12085 [Methylomirabilota bacterium]|nr:hypothetical protein [Methylomirabilota bacterium]